MDKGLQKKIEWHLYNYYELYQAIENNKDIIYYSGSSQDLSKERVQTSATDPFDNKVKLMDKNTLIAAWIDCIEKTMAQCRYGPKRQLIELYYFKDCKEGHVRKALHIEHATFHNWKTTMLYDFAVEAARLNLI